MNEDAVLKASQKLSYAKEDQSYWEDHISSMGYIFNVPEIIISYTLKNDGGDASNNGLLSLRLTDEEAEAIIDARLEKAKRDVDEARAALQELTR